MAKDKFGFILKACSKYDKAFSLSPNLRYELPWPIIVGV